MYFQGEEKNQSNKSQKNEDVLNQQIYRTDQTTYYSKNDVHFIEQDFGAFKLINVIKVLPALIINDLIYYFCNFVTAQVDFLSLQIYLLDSDFFNQTLQGINGNKLALKDLMNISRNQVYIKFQSKMMNCKQYDNLIGLVLNASSLITICLNKIININQTQEPFQLDQEIHDLCQSLQNLG